MTQATDFPRTDLGETEQFKICSGHVDGGDGNMWAFHPGRRNFIKAADVRSGARNRQSFMCLHCQAWDIDDKAVHVCERGLQR